MRLDKFLKVSRIIKRRTVANEDGDVIEITFGQKVTKYQVLNVTEYATKESASSMYKEL